MLVVTLIQLSMFPSPTSWTFLVVGGILFVVTLVGFLGALRENRCLLWIYDITLTILILAKGDSEFYFMNGLY